MGGRSRRCAASTWVCGGARCSVCSGPNGAGKSTLVKILMTVISRTEGNGTLLGRPLGDKDALRKVGYLPEHHRFPGYLKGKQVIDFFGAMAGVPRKERRRKTGELLEIVGMQRLGKHAGPQVLQGHAPARRARAGPRE
jgi:ABC-type multidrug transport system ATPase subunit